MKRLNKLQQDRANAIANGKSIAAAADKENRALTPEEREQLAAIQAEIQDIDQELRPLLALLEAERATVLPGDLGAQPTGGDEFKSLGEFLQAVARAGRSQGADVDSRLRMGALATGMGESAGSDGGFLVRQDFSTLLLQRAMEEAVLAPKCFRVPIGPGFSGIELPVIHETSRATGSRWGGVQVYRRAEGATVEASKPTFGSLNLKLLDLLGICYATDELLEDATALEAIVTASFASEFAFRLDDEIFRGNGAGQMLGIINSGALVSIAKESGQPADTILAENVIKMFAAMPPKNASRAFWLVNQETWPQLFKMHFTVGTGGVPVFLPPGQLAAAPFGTLLGRPILPIEQASALGDLGDIVFADLQEYLLVEKGGLRADVSMHVRFLYGENTFRFKMRNNGMPAWSEPRSPYKGAQSQSPFVALAARA